MVVHHTYTFLVQPDPFDNLSIMTPTSRYQITLPLKPHAARSQVQDPILQGGKIEICCGTASRFRGESSWLATLWPDYRDLRLNLAASISSDKRRLSAFHRTGTIDVLG